jgi:hypothetical protein
VSLPIDALSIDNHAYLLPSDHRKLSVRLSIEDEALADAMSRAMRASGRVEPRSAALPHLMVTDKTATATDKTWVVHVHAAEDAQAYLGPFVVDHQHPLAAGLTLGGEVWSAGEIDLPGAPVISAGNVPLLTVEPVGERGRRIHVNLRYDLSSVQATPNWPVLWWNIIAARLEALPGAARAQYRLGETVTVDLADDPQQPPTVTDPAGAVRESPAINRRLVIAPESPGVWQVASGDEVYRFAVNAQGRDESNLASAASNQWGRWIDDAQLRQQYVSVTWLPVLLALAGWVTHQLLVHRASRAGEVMT